MPTRGWPIVESNDIEECLWLGGKLHASIQSRVGFKDKCFMSGFLVLNIIIDMW